MTARLFAAALALVTTGLTQAIVTERPRLLLSPARIDKLKLRINANTQEWIRFKALADQYLISTPGYATTDIAQGMALLYRIDPALYSAYGDRAAVLTLLDLDGRFPNVPVNGIAQPTAATTLTSAMAASGGGVNVASSAGFSQGDCVFVDAEPLRINSISGTSWTVTRGYGGVFPVSHASGKTVTRCPILSTGAPHGIIGASEPVAAGGLTGPWRDFNNVFVAFPASPSTAFLACRPYVSLATGIDSCFAALAAPPASFAGQEATLFRNGTLINSLNSMRYYYGGYALVYDWAYDRLTPVQKTRIRHFLMNVVHRNTGTPYGGCGAANIGGNLCGGQFRSTAYATIALAGDWDEAQMHYDFYRTLFLNSMAPYVRNLHGRGGLAQEGIEYDGDARKLYLQYLEAALSGTGENLYAAVPGFVTGLLSFYQYATSPQPGTEVPNNYEPIPYGDVQSNMLGRWEERHRAAMVMVLDYLSANNHTALAGNAKYWLDTFKPNFGISGMTIGYQYFDFLYYDPFVSPASYFHQPLTYTHPGMNIFLGRSDWTPAATWLNSSCGPTGIDHLRHENGMVQIYRNGKWLTRQVRGYDPQFISSFAMTLNPWFDFTANLRVPYSGSSAGECVMEVEEGSNESFSHLRQDFSAAFSGTGYNVVDRIDSAVRDVLWLKPDFAVLADRWKFVSGNSRMPAGGSLGGIILRAETPPLVEGSRITVTNSGEKLVMDRVWPPSATAVVRDGSAFNVIFAQASPADSTLTEIVFDNFHSLATQASCGDSSGTPLTISGLTGAWSVLNGTWKAVSHPDNQLRRNRVRICVNTSAITEPFWGQTGATGIAKVPGPWAARVDISSGQRALEDSQMYFLQTLGASTVAVTPATLSSSSTIVAAAAGSNVVVHRKTAAAPQTWQYTVNTLAPLHHYVLGCVPGGYGVSISGAGVTLTEGGTQLNCSPTGLLRFATQGGALATLIAATPANVTIHCSAGQTVPAAAPLSLSAAGPATLATSTSQPWLSVNNGAGTAPLAAEVVVNCGSLSTGQYTGEITVTSSTAGVVNSPQTIKVNVIASTGPNLMPSRTPVEFNATVGGSSPAAELVTVRLDGSSTDLHGRTCRSLAHGGSGMHFQLHHSAGSATDRQHRPPTGRTTYRHGVAFQRPDVRAGRVAGELQVTLNLAADPGGVILTANPESIDLQAPQGEQSGAQEITLTTNTGTANVTVAD